MATSHATGLEALVVSAGSTRPEVIEALLKRTARDLRSARRDDECGHGLIGAKAVLRGLGVVR